MTTYTSSSYKNPFVPKNPFEGIVEAVEAWERFWSKVGYWINPINLFKEMHRGLHWLVNQPETAEYLMIGTIVGGMLIMLGAKFPKKYIFWGWIGYWVLRGVIYRN